MCIIVYSSIAFKVFWIGCVKHVFNWSRLVNIPETRFIDIYSISDLNNDERARYKWLESIKLLRWTWETNRAQYDELKNKSIIKKRITRGSGRVVSKSAVNGQTVRLNSSSNFNLQFRSPIAYFICTIYNCIKFARNSPHYPVLRNI